MKPGKTARNRGQALLGAVVATAIIAIAMSSLLSMFKLQSGATRGLASVWGKADLARGLDVLFSGSQCATTGTFLNSGSPAVVRVSREGYSLLLDRIQFPSGTVAVSSLPDPNLATMIQPSFILPPNHSPPGIHLIALGGSGRSGTGFQYPFQMQVRFGNASGSAPAPINKFITVYTDSAQKVQGACYTGSGSTGQFGGIYTTRVQDGSCRFANPFTSACTCPPGYAVRLFHDWATSCVAFPPEPAFSQWNCTLYQDRGAPVPAGTVVGISSYFCYR